MRANYKNAVKGIDYTPVYLERFFRNLLLGERWDLRNRYLHIKAPEQAPEQAQEKYRTSTGQVENTFHTDNVNIKNLIKIIGDKLFKRESLGGGDIKLAFVIGYALGFRLSLIAIILSSFLALPYSVASLKLQKNNEVPFGPFLVSSLFIVFLFQDKFINILGFFN